MKRSSFTIESDAPAMSTYLPVLSIILPSQNRQSLQQQLNNAKLQVKQMLAACYPETAVQVTLQRLDKLTADIQSPADFKGIALFASSNAGKLVFLHSNVRSNISINHSGVCESFVLLLSAEKALLYLHKGNQIVPVKFPVPANRAAYQNDVPSRVANFSDPAKRKEVQLDKLLHHIDLGLDTILKETPLPVWLIAPERVAGHFGKNSKHVSSIAGFIHGNYIDATEAELLKLLKPGEKEKLDNDGALQQMIRQAEDEKRLVSGMHAVRYAAKQKNAKLLLVEEDITEDALIENVIAAGGDVHVFPKNELSEYDHVALIRYYEE